MALFYTGLNPAKQVITFQIGAGLIIGKITALFRPCLMDQTTFAHPVIGQKNTGTVFSGLKSVFSGKIPVTDLAVGNLKMTGDTIYINSHDIKACTVKPVTAVTGTIAAKRFIAGKRIFFCVAAHGRNSLDCISWRRIRR
jgi:hypothetical protein